MKQIKKVAALSTGLLALPLVSFAQDIQNFDSSGGEFGKLLANILEFTNTVLIPFITGIGFLVFVFGMFQFFIVGGANDEKKEQGKSLMIYATLGFVLIIVFWGIINLLTSSTGLAGGTVNNIPTVNVITEPN
jgi:uncharacterized membrane protein YidH (DUF202 family)